MHFIQSRVDESDKFEVIGTVPGVSSSGDEEEEGPVTLRPNRFRPKAGIRERLRTNLQENLERQKSDEDYVDEKFENEDTDESFTLRPPRTR